MWWSGDTYQSCGELALSEHDWLFARRYVWMLHGSMHPDSNEMTYENDGIDVPAERLANPYSCWWSFKGNFEWALRLHSIFFVEDQISEEWIPSKFYIPGVHSIEETESLGKGWAAENAMLAAADSLRFINKKNDDGSLDYKYEAAAFCIGGMSHFISDLVHPHHTTYQEYQTSDVNRHNTHWYWDQWVAYRTIMEENIHGGPLYTRLDVTIEEFMAERNLNLYPMLPYEAALRTAEYNALGLDHYGSGRSIYDWDGDIDTHYPASAYQGLSQDWPGQPGFDPRAGARMTEIVNWAVYHIACAILWILQFTDVENRNTTEGRDNYSNGIPPIGGPVDRRDIFDWVKAKGLSEGSGWPESYGGYGNYLNTSLSTSMFILAPLMLVGLAGLLIPMIDRKSF